MTPRFVLSCLLPGLLVAPIALAGTVDPTYFGELDGTFTRGASDGPGRSAVLHDVSGSNLTDIGINAFSDGQTGAITTIAKVDIANADTNLWGIGIGRVLFSGAADTSFGGGDGKIEFTTLGITNVIDACRDNAGRFVVAAATPGANGSAGAKDLALVRFTAAGALDTSYSTDGVARFSLIDDATDYDEAINDLECLPNGHYYIGGYINDSSNRRRGFMAQMPASGNHDAAMASQSFGLTAGDAESQVTAIHYNAAVGAHVAALTTIGDTNLSRSVLVHYAIRDDIAFDLMPFPLVLFGSDHCLPFTAPSISGIDRLSDTDYVVSLNYTGSGQRRAAVGRVNIGESLLVSCTQAPFSLTGAAVTPPLVHAGAVFVGLGIAPLNATPVQSEVRMYVPSANGLNLLVEDRFGTSGKVGWSYAFSTGNANNNRSFIQRLYADPAGLLMAVGTRVWNGNDTDVALARLGSSGIFRSGFETPN